MLALCIETDCQMKFRRPTGTGRLVHDGRCPKCAAYHRGKMKRKEAERQRERRKPHGEDATEGREERMEERGKVLSEFLRGQ